MMARIEHSFAARGRALPRRPMSALTAQTVKAPPRTLFLISKQARNKPQLHVPGYSKLFGEGPPYRSSLRIQKYYQTNPILKNRFAGKQRGFCVKCIKLERKTNPNG